MSELRDDLAAALLAGMQAMQEENGWTFMDLTVKDDGRVWIETTSSIDLRELADKLLTAGWRLVPVEDGCAGRDHQWGESAPVCTSCGYVRTFSAMSMEAAQRTFSQHRAADEHTHQDQAAGIYDGPRPSFNRPQFDPTDPAMISAVKEYFQHGFDNATIMAASFPGLTPEIIDALRTDQHGPHEA